MNTLREYVTVFGRPAANNPASRPWPPTRTSPQDLFRGPAAASLPRRRSMSRRRERDAARVALPMGSATRPQLPTQTGQASEAWWVCRSHHQFGSPSDHAPYPTTTATRCRKYQNSARWILLVDRHLTPLIDNIGSRCVEGISVRSGSSGVFGSTGVACSRASDSGASELNAESCSVITCSLHGRHTPP